MKEILMCKKNYSETDVFGKSEILFKKWNSYLVYFPKEGYVMAVTEDKQLFELFTVEEDKPINAGIDDFVWNYFYTKEELRKYKLEKINLKI